MAKVKNGHPTRQLVILQLYILYIIPVYKLCARISCVVNNARSIIERFRVCIALFYFDVFSVGENGPT